MESLWLVEDAKDDDEFTLDYIRYYRVSKQWDVCCMRRELLLWFKVQGLGRFGKSSDLGCLASPRYSRDEAERGSSGALPGLLRSLPSYKSEAHRPISIP